MFTAPITPTLHPATLPEPAPRFGPTHALALRATEFDALVGRLLHRAIAGEEPAEIHTDFCRKLGELMALPLVLLGRALDSGSIMLEAASHDGTLWLDLQRLPERWDSGIASRGPAGAALKLDAPAHFSVADEGFVLWRQAALQDRVAEVLAIALPGKPRRVLELFFEKPVAEGARRSGTLSVAELGARTATFLEDLERIARSQLVAHALEAAGAGAFITDLDASIVWCNAAFSKLSGFTPAQAIGQKPNIVRSGHQGVRYYRELWEALRTGKTWTGETVDRARDGTEYTILQSVSPVAPHGRVTHYLSIHQDIGRQRHERTRLQAMSREDPLTGTLTRAAFEDSAQKVFQAATDTGSPLVLVMLSLREMHDASLRLSPEQEARAMSEVGRRLRKLTPWLTGYFGSSEFVMLFADEEAREEAALLGRLAAIEEALKAPLELPDRSIECHAHFGVARFPADGLALELLLSRADRRLADEPFHRARRHAHNRGTDHD